MNGEDDREATSPSKFFPTKPVRPHSRVRKTSLNQKNNKRNKQPEPERQPEPEPQPEPELEIPKEDPTAFYTAAATEDGATGSVVLKPCPNCGRKFAVERLAKHSKVCKDSAKKLAKRKVFDPVKMRLEGTEAAQFTHKTDKKVEVSI